jgi:hypothetical protein
MTIDRESELNLAADAPAAGRFLLARGGLLHPPADGEAGIWWAQLHPAEDPTEEFFARLAWTVYPGAAPSIKFSTTLGGPLADPGAWPVAPGYRPACLDVCKPISAEGFALHPDWGRTNQAWTGRGNPFLAVVQELQRDLNGPGFSGRFGS